MKELFDKILKYLPQYIGDFTRMLRGPKAFLGRQAETEGDTAYIQGLTFLAMSFCLIFLLKWSGGPEEQTFKAVFIKEFVLEVIGYIVIAGLLLLAWRLVGCRGNSRGMLTAYAYVAGVLVLVQGLFFQAAMGTMRMLDEEQHAMMKSMASARSSGDIEALMAEAQNLDFEDPMRQAAISATTGIAVIGDLIALLWFIVSWGAFRRLLGASKVRSVVAFVVFLLFDSVNPWDMVKFAVMNAVT